MTGLSFPLAVEVVCHYVDEVQVAVELDVVNTSFIYKFVCRGAVAQACKRDKLWIGFQFGKTNYYLCFYFFALVERSVGFHHLTCNVSKIGGELRRECFNTKLPLPILLYKGYLNRPKISLNKHSLN